MEDAEHLIDRILFLDGHYFETQLDIIERVGAENYLGHQTVSD